jgi:hypothetical protein
MKQLIIMILILSTIPTTIAINCIETDSGKDYNEKGTTTYRDRERTDYCRDDRLTEYYCDGQRQRIAKITCGFGCSEGACITNKPKPKEPELSCQQKERYVLQSDAIANHTDFRNKCVVGVCTNANERNIWCFGNTSQDIQIETLSCSSGFNYQPISKQVLCINNSLRWHDDLNTPLSYFCKSPETIVVQYVALEPAQDWRQHWDNNFKQLQDYLKEFNIHINYTIYYGYQPNIQGDVRLVIDRGKSSSANVFDKTISLPHTAPYHTLLHEFGHVIGCSHTGEGGSLIHNLNDNRDVMSYSGNDLNYLYECRLIAWMVGNEN